ncbi:hypothetical protein Tco_0221368 [Tanacetum coccineum]
MSPLVEANVLLGGLNLLAFPPKRGAWGLVMEVALVVEWYDSAKTFRYCSSVRIESSGYGVLIFIPFVVFGECRHGYAVSSLMDTVYWSLE